MPAQNEGALGPYLRAVRSHKLVVALATLAALAGALAWTTLRTPDYDASAEILVTPVPQEDQIYVGLPLLRDSGEPTRTIQTAATLFESASAERETALRLDLTRTQVGDAISVNAKGESNILEIKARATTAEAAAELANTYAESSLDIRSELIAERVQRTLEQLREREASLGEGATSEVAVELQRRISALEALEDGDDPTMNVAEAATEPREPVGLPPFIVLPLVVIAGLVFGTALALALSLSERRLRDEDDVLAAYPLPVLTRVPLLSRRVLRRPGMPPPVREAYRTLIAQVEVRAPGDRVLMLTSASRNDGKTTAAINLAMSLVASGRRVILIDFDLRKPDVARRLGVDSGQGLLPMLASDAQIEDVLVPAPQLPLLQVATAASTAGDVALLEALIRRLPAILDQATAAADYVVVDTAPLGEVSDAVKVIDHVDAVILATRPGNTDASNLAQTRELLESAGREPLGMIVLGGQRGGPSTYYGYGAERERPMRRQLTS